MKRTITKIALALSFTVLALAWLFSFELLREAVVYGRYSAELEAQTANIKIGMTEDQLKQLLGSPDYVNENESGLFWSWNARARPHQGYLFTKMGLATSKGHYGVSVRFDGLKRVAEIDGGVN